MEIEIREVNEENLEEVLGLDVAESQQSFIESTRECLEDALNYKNYVPVGLYREKVLVGFAMYGSFGEGENTRVWLDRFLIDQRFQNQGLGHLMLEKLIEHLEAVYACENLFLSLYKDNKKALHLYEKFGFKFTGERDVNGEEIMVKSLP